MIPIYQCVERPMGIYGKAGPNFNKVYLTFIITSSTVWSWSFEFWSRIQINYCIYPTSLNKIIWLMGSSFTLGCYFYIAASFRQRMCWCLREKGKGGTILSCWLRTIHIYCNLKYVCVFVCAHVHVCVAWTCWCEQDAHMCVHVMMTETGISYCSPFLSPSISWGRISHGTWSSPFGSGYLVPKSPRSTRVATSPLFSTGVTVSVLAFIWVLRARSQMLLVVQQTFYPWSQLPRPKYSYVWNEQFYL